MAGKSDVAWVTGAAGTIGQAIVQRLRADGYTVLGFDLDGDERESRVRSLGGTFVPVDLSRADSIAAAVQAAARHGSPALLVNNAAVVPERALLEDVSLDAWNLSIAVDLTAPMLLMQAVAPMMKANGGGALVSIASSSAVRVSAGFASYVSAKAALIALTKVAAVELAPFGITANTVCPGVVDSPLARAALGGDAAVASATTAGPLANPMGRSIPPSDIAELVGFLARARHINGQTIHCNAGSFMP